MIRAFLRGLREGFAGCEVGLTFDGDAESPRSRAYDRGLTLGQAFGGLVR